MPAKREGFTKPTAQSAPPATKPFRGLRNWQVESEKRRVYEEVKRGCKEKP